VYEKRSRDSERKVAWISAALHRARTETFKYKSRDKDEAVSSWICTELYLEVSVLALEMLIPLRAPSPSKTLVSLQSSKACAPPLSESTSTAIASYQARQRSTSSPLFSSLSLGPFLTNSRTLQVRLSVVAWHQSQLPNAGESGTATDNSLDTLHS